jgi:hypothetical protein
LKPDSPKIECDRGALLGRPTNSTSAENGTYETNSNVDVTVDSDTALNEDFAFQTNENGTVAERVRGNDNDGSCSIDQIQSTANIQRRQVTGNKSIDNDNTTNTGTQETWPSCAMVDENNDNERCYPNVPLSETLNGLDPVSFDNTQCATNLQHGTPSKEEWKVGTDQVESLSYDDDDDDDDDEEEDTAVDNM